MNIVFVFPASISSQVRAALPAVHFGRVVLVHGAQQNRLAVPRRERRALPESVVRGRATRTGGIVATTNNGG